MQPPSERAPSPEVAGPDASGHEAAAAAASGGEEGARETNGNPVVATWSQAGPGTLTLYRDGTLEHRYETRGGAQTVTGSVVGAAARIRRFGSRMLLRDTRQTFLTIEGPQVAVSVEVDRYVGVGGAQGFAAQVNQLAQQLAAATAGAPRTTSVPDQLAQLADFRDRGVLTSDEFERAKRRLLEDV